MRDPAVVGMPRVVSTSLIASGTPASGCSFSPAGRRRSMSAPGGGAGAWVVSQGGGGKGWLVGDVQKGVQGAVNGVDAVEVGLCDVHRRHLTRNKLSAQFSGGQANELGCRGVA